MAKVFEKCVMAWATAALLAPLAANAVDESSQLALVLRQLDAIDRMAQHNAAQTRTTPSRYYFDYQRLHLDIQRVRQGVQDYLSPPRAQPRDAMELIADYRDQQEPTP